MYKNDLVNSKYQSRSIDLVYSTILSIIDTYSAFDLSYLKGAMLVNFVALTTSFYGGKEGLAYLEKISWSYHFILLVSLSLLVLTKCLKRGGGFQDSLRFVAAFLLMIYSILVLPLVFTMLTQIFDQGFGGSTNSNTMNYINVSIAVFCDSQDNYF